jgi:hypothetical protein
MLSHAMYGKIMVQSDATLLSVTEKVTDNLSRYIGSNNSDM